MHLTSGKRYGDINSLNACFYRYTDLKKSRYDALANLLLFENFGNEQPRNVEIQLASSDFDQSSTSALIDYLEYVIIPRHVMRLKFQRVLNF